MGRAMDSHGLYGEVQLFGGQLVESNPRLEGKDLGYFSSHYQVRLEPNTIKDHPKAPKKHRKFTKWTKVNSDGCGHIGILGILPQVLLWS